MVRGTDGPAVSPGKGEGLLLGVRPEDVALTSGPGLAARVRTVEYLGADSIVSCAVGRQTLAVRAPGRVELPDAATVRLTWKPEATHLFDATTGTRCVPA
ncbi:MAG: TOBE domain-containing protein [Gammaproteobacteria bacterium]